MRDRFFADILRNGHNRTILDRWSAFGLRSGWLVAGCLFQTVWNLQAGRDPQADIKDYDLFYFDSSDTSEVGEQHVQARVDEVLGDLGVGVRPDELYAPNGLALLYDGILTMNPLTPHQDLFERKAASYRTRWPWLQIQAASPLASMASVPAW